MGVLKFIGVMDYMVFFMISFMIVNVMVIVFRCLFVG